MSMVGELVKTLRDRSFRFAHDIYFKPTTKDLLSQAADTIEELSAKVARQNMERSSQYYGGGWIPVEDGLPEDGEEVLVWYEYFRYGDYNRMFQTYGIGYEYNGYWGGDVYGYRARCIAWQPLPPAFEQQED